MFRTPESDFFLKKDKKALPKELESLMCLGTTAANEQLHAILHKVDPRDVVNASGTTLLHLAAGSCNLSMTRHLIKIGCDLEAKDNLGRTPIIVALEKRYIENVELLLEANADVLAVDSTGQSALGMVLHKPDQLYAYLVKFFLRKVTVGCESNEETAETLRGLDCPLDCVVCLANADVTRMMLERGYFPEIDAKRNGDNAALHVAVYLTDASNVTALLEHGANVNVQNDDGKTPLMLNFFDRDDDDDLKVLDALLNYGADLTAWDSNGKMQVYQLLSRGKIDAIRMVIQRGLDLNATDEQLSTPLFYLIENKNALLAVKGLKDAKVDWNARNGSGLTVLHLATSRGDPKLVRFLTSMGADVNARDATGRTPLFHAFVPGNVRRHRECAEVLLERGADAQVACYLSSTLIDLACTFYNYDTVEPIIAHLALREELGTPIIEPIRRRIQSYPSFQECYCMRRRQLQRMRTDFVYGAVTMFKILTESEETIARYARKQETAEIIQERARDDDSYYYEILRERFARARRLAVLRNRAMIVLRDEVCHFDDIVLHKIVGFLSYDDLKLFE